MGHFNSREIVFASKTIAVGNLGTSDDPLAAVADMFSMGTACKNILATHPRSTYLMMAAALMNESRIYPQTSWDNQCKKR